jgi:hypothetical protein
MTRACRIRSSSSARPQSQVCHSSTSFAASTGRSFEQLVSIMDTLARRTEAPNLLGRTDYMNEADVFRRVLLARGATEKDRLSLEHWVMFTCGAFLLRFSDDLGRGSFKTGSASSANLASNSDFRAERLVVSRKIAKPTSFRESPMTTSTRSAASTNNNGGRSGSRPSSSAVTPTGGRLSSGRRRTHTSAAI